MRRIESQREQWPDRTAALRTAVMYPDPFHLPPDKEQAIQDRMNELGPKSDDTWRREVEQRVRIQQLLNDMTPEERAAVNPQDPVWGSLGGELGGFLKSWDRWQEIKQEQQRSDDTIAQIEAMTPEERARLDPNDPQWSHLRVVDKMDLGFYPTLADLPDSYVASHPELGIRIKMERDRANRAPVAIDKNTQTDFASLTDRLRNEIHQWAGYAGEGDDPVTDWPKINQFLEANYPLAAGKSGETWGMEGAQQKLLRQDHTKPATGGDYDPAQIGAGVLYLHSFDQGRTPEEFDADLLQDVFQKRQKMQRDYEQRSQLPPVGLGNQRSQLPPVGLGNAGRKLPQ